MSVDGAVASSGRDCDEVEEGRAMPEYLPNVYTDFRAAYPEVADALDALSAASDAAGPLDTRNQRLVKLAIAVGASAEGAVRSNVRKALDAGAGPEEIRQVGVLAVTTIGFPAAVAGLSWIEEVLVTKGAPYGSVSTTPAPDATSNEARWENEGGAVPPISPRDETAPG